jgi:hypothetical protein
VAPKRDPGLDLTRSCTPFDSNYLRCPGRRYDICLHCRHDRLHQARPHSPGPGRTRHLSGSCAFGGRLPRGGAVVAFRPRRSLGRPLPSSPLQIQDRPATRRRPAAARIPGERLIVEIVGVHPIGVVVRELFTGLDRPLGEDEDAPADVGRLAARLARVVDEARLVAVHGGVDRGLAIDGEKKRVVALHRFVVVAGVGFGVGDPFAGVFDDACPRANFARSDCAAPLNPGATKLEVRRACAHDRRK